MKKEDRIESLKLIKGAESLTEAMILAEASGFTKDELGEIFVLKAKQLRGEKD